MLFLQEPLFVGGLLMSAAMLVVSERLDSEGSRNKMQELGEEGSGRIQSGVGGGFGRLNVKKHEPNNVSETSAPIDATWLTEVRASRVHSLPGTEKIHRVKRSRCSGACARSCLSGGEAQNLETCLVRCFNVGFCRK